MSDKKIDIERIVFLLRKEVKNFKEPSVTEISDRFSNPFHVLVSCILSLRTKDETTSRASMRLFKVADSPEEISRLSTNKIENLIYPVGFYRTKARNIKQICSDLINKFNSKVPDNLEDLLSLKGVGRKTANLVLTEGFSKEGICVDTHVHRISNRLGYVKTKSPFDTEMALRKKLPRKFWIEYNYLLVTWGQNICKPISPFCSKCALSNICQRIDVGNNR